MASYCHDEICTLGTCGSDRSNENSKAWTPRLEEASEVAEHRLPGGETNSMGSRIANNSNHSSSYENLNPDEHPEIIIPPWDPGGRWSKISKNKEV